MKRINEFILDARSQWSGDWKAFSNLVKRSQENIDDITFQVAVIDRNGLLVFSNLAKPSDRTDLSEREHFRVHRDTKGVDRLFISKPVLGKISGKWSIQVTRPIYKGGSFEGVVVVSLSPDQFANFAEKMRIGMGSALTVVRSSGEIMARYPNKEGSLGMVLTNRPYLDAEPPALGNFFRTAAVDGLDRVWGYYRLPEYGMNFVMGESLSDVLAPYTTHKRQVLSVAAGVSIFAIFLFFVLSRSLGALDEVRRQLAEIFLLSPDGFVSFDENQRVKYASPTFRDMTGLAEAQVAGLTESAFAQCFAAVCADKSQLLDMPALREVQASGLTSEDKEDGGRQLIELAAPHSRMLEVGLRVSEAETVSQILYFRDVTHETEVDRMKSEFLSTAAHELRTPMASIYGFAELLLAEEFDAETQRELLETIYRQSGLMASIINELLDLARIESRRGKDFVFETLNLVDVVGDAVAGYKPPEGREPPVLTSTGVLLVRADSKKLQQALTNLISNAYKYSPAGGDVSIRYRVEAHGGRPMVGLEVCDSGIGMTSAQQNRVFERFYRADTSGKIPGTGLGMSIVKEIIDIHRGHIDLESELGRGTCVTVWLPEFEAAKFRLEANDAGPAVRR